MPLESGLERLKGYVDRVIKGEERCDGERVVELVEGFGEGRWSHWPPAPAPVKFLVSTLLWRIHGGIAKFSAVDRQGKMRPLYAVPTEAKSEKQ
jgi:hypothetical protein